MSAASSVEQAALVSAARQQAAIGKVMDGYVAGLADPSKTPETGKRFGCSSWDQCRSRRERRRHKAIAVVLRNPDLVHVLASDRQNGSRLGSQRPRGPGSFLHVHGAHRRKSPDHQWGSADHLVTRLPHSLGDGLVTFAQFDYKSHPVDPRALLENQRDLMTLSWTDKDGHPLDRLLVPEAAYGALAVPFFKIADTIREVENHS